MDGFAGGDFGGADPMGAYGEEEAKGGSNEKPTKDKNIIPATIKMIKSAPWNKDKATVDLDNVNPEFVSIMGRLGEVETQSTRDIFQISDGTGSIQLTRWKEENNILANERFSECVEGATVWVVGGVKQFGEQYSIQVYTMRKIDDFNEMTHHLLEVMLTHARNTKGPIPGSAAASMQMNNVNAHNPFAITPGKSSGMALSSGGGNSDKQDALVQAARFCSEQGGEQGGTAEDMAKYLTAQGKSIALNEIKSFLTASEDDGRCFSTVDEDHFQWIPDF